MLIDSCIFFNEVALLELRMKEIYELVDKFIVVEAAQTFAGHKKPLYLQEHRQNIYDPDKKLIYVTLPALPPLAGNTEADRFWLEAYHRNAIMQGLLKLDLTPTDRIIVSDVDEIPSVSGIEEYVRDIAPTQTVQFSQMFLKFYFDEEIDDGYNRLKWGGSVGVPYSIFGKAMPQDVRRKIGCAGQKLDLHLAKQRGLQVIDQGGWHLSSFGGKISREYKLSHYAHGTHAPTVLDGKAERVLLGTHGRPEQQLKSDDILETLQATEKAANWPLPRTVVEEPLAYSRFFKKFDTT